MRQLRQRRTVGARDSKSNGQRPRPWHARRSVAEETADNEEISAFIFASLVREFYGLNDDGLTRSR
jgi:hypothetical protein